MTLKELEGTLKDIKDDIRMGQNMSAGFYLDSSELKSILQELIRYRKVKNVSRSNKT